METFTSNNLLTVLISIMVTALISIIATTYTNRSTTKLNIQQKHYEAKLSAYSAYLKHFAKIRIMDISDDKVNLQWSEINVGLLDTCRLLASEEVLEIINDNKRDLYLEQSVLAEAMRRDLVNHLPKK